MRKAPRDRGSESMSLSTDKGHLLPCSLESQIVSTGRTSTSTGLVPHHLAPRSLAHL